jgi:hypothetical protein
MNSRRIAARNAREETHRIGHRWFATLPPSPGIPPVRFRIGATQGVHIYIEINDLERGAAFYVNGVGLRVLRRFTPKWVELAGAQNPIHLLARPEPTFETGDHVLRKVVTRHWTPIHLDLVVDDLEPAVARAVRAGAVLERRVDHPGLWRLAALADPFGHGFDLIEDPEAGYAALAARG